jgi:hypothetical protein
MCLCIASVGSVQLLIKSELSFRSSRKTKAKRHLCSASLSGSMWKNLKVLSSGRSSRSRDISPVPPEDRFEVKGASLGEGSTTEQDNGNQSDDNGDIDFTLDSAPEPSNSSLDTPTKFRYSSIDPEMTLFRSLTEDIQQFSGEKLDFEFLC